MGPCSRLPGPPATCETKFVRKLSQCVLLVWILTLLLQIGTPRTYAQSGPASNPAEKERDLLEAIQRDPNNLQAVGSLGEYYFHREQWPQSVRWLTRAYQLSSRDTAVGYDLAFALKEAGDLEAAQRQVEELLSKADTSKLHSLLAEIDDRRGAYVDAAKEYHRAAELEPSESNIFDLATFLLQHKKYVGFLDDSIKFFRYGVAQYPRSSQMLVGLGVALYADNEYDEAVRVFCSAVDLDPNDRRPIQFLGRASRVSPELAQEVDRRLQDFAQRYPENAAANYFYALSLWERGGGDQGRDLDKIERLFRKAEALSPEWYEPHYQLGVVYEAQQRYDEAIREMNRAVKIDPDFFPAHYRLAVLYNRLGQRAAAAAEASAVKKLKEKDSDETSHDVSQ
jgi:tetratricopeptide (TPR) repeat protein